MLNLRHLVALAPLALLVVVAACGSDDEPGQPSGPTDAGVPSGSDGSIGPGSSGDAGPESTDAAAHDASDANDAATKPLPTPPADLVKCLDAKPYVEQTCTPTTVVGWPYPAKECQYSSPIGTLTVTVADPTAEQAAIWIMDAGDSIPAIAHLKTSDPASYLSALQTVAAALMIQSSRIFPIAGKVGEDQGDGYYGYPFTKGVTTPCPSGEPHCYCRINSLSRGDYCDYRSAKGVEGVDACRTRVGYGGGSTSAWQDECIGNHRASWDKADNEHIRAQVWVRLHDAGITDTASGDQVVNALRSNYGVTSATVASFCK